MRDLTGPEADAAIAPASSGSLERYTALIAALLGVRTDDASARFDAELTAAIAANRLDVATARTLRWWQRASVREVERYASSVLPAALASRFDADQAAAVDGAESAASWQRAQAALPASNELASPVEPAQPVELAPPARPARVITIPDPSTRRRSAKEIQQAVREALRATAAPRNAGPPLDVHSAQGAFTHGAQGASIPSPQDASAHGRDRGDHAHTAPTA